MTYSLEVANDACYGTLAEGSSVTIVGGGPGGVAAALYLQKERPDLDINVLEYRNEKRSLTPACGSCKGGGGVMPGQVLKTLEEDLGLTVPERLIMNRYAGYDFHRLGTDKSYSMSMPTSEVMPGADKEYDTVSVYRGNGPARFRGDEPIGFDAYLRKEAKDRGIGFTYGSVKDIIVPESLDGKVMVNYKGTSKGDDLSLATDLVINAAGVKGSQLARMGYMDDTGALQYRDRDISPRSRTFGQFEVKLPKEDVESYFGDTISVYTGIPGSEFIAVTPKFPGPQKEPMRDGSTKDVDYGYLSITLALDPRKERELDKLGSEKEVRSAYANQLRGLEKALLEHPGFSYKVENRIDDKPFHCLCQPSAPVSASVKPFEDRYVEIGDAGGAIRYGKNGIGHSILSARAAVDSILERGISEEAFRDGYYTDFVKPLDRDNAVGKAMFGANRVVAGNDTLASLFYSTANSPVGKPIKKLAYRMARGHYGEDSYKSIVGNAVVDAVKLPYELAGSAIRSAVDKYHDWRERSNSDEEPEA